MQALPSPLEVSPVHHLPLGNAAADSLGVVRSRKPLVPTALEVDVGTVVLGGAWDTRSGRRPLYRLEEFFAPQDPAWR